MKSKEEVVGFRDTLVYLLENPQPCNCAETGHDFECTVGHYQWIALAVFISWILGEEEGYQEVVDRLNDVVEEIRTRAEAPAQQSHEDPNSKASTSDQGNTEPPDFPDSYH